MKTSWQNFWIVIKFPIYSKEHAPEKIIFVKSSKVEMVYFRQILQKRNFLAFIFGQY